MSAPTPVGGFSLFPSTGQPPQRTQAARSPQTHQQQQQQQQFGEAVTADGRQPAPTPAPAPEPETAAATTPEQDPHHHHPPNRSNSVRSRSSIAKVRLSTYDDNAPEMDDPPPPMPGQAADMIEQQQLQQQQQRQQQQQQSQQSNQSTTQPALRSIFPTYNPDVSLDQQQYFPTQTSPTRIPRNVISRPLYTPVDQPQQQSQPQLQPIATITPASRRQQSVLYAPPLITDLPRYPGPAVAAAAAEPSSLQPLQPMLQREQRSQQPPLQQQQQQPQNQNQQQTWPSSSGATAAAAMARGSRGEAPSRPVPSSTEDLRSLWKVANGWKAGPSEGRVYCMRMSCDRDAPIYRLCSANNQPFYRLRVDPTSMSAKVTLARHDPARAFKVDSSSAASGAADDGGLGSGSRSNSLLEVGGGGGGHSSANSVLAGGSAGMAGSTTGSAAMASGSVAAGAATTATTSPPNPYHRFDGSKNWQEAMTTTLEEESRRHQPQDGLVALLYPSAAARLALERAHDMAMVMTAERECARLVWDDDTRQYFLVHPALALPFCVTIERSTTWSRTAYTLEHLESPQHLARLTRDATGAAGYLEVDTSIAAKIDAVYLVDVAVAALVLVAHSDKQFAAVEQFEPPPPPVTLAAAAAADPRGPSPRTSLATMVLMGATGRSSRQSMASGLGGGAGGGGVSGNGVVVDGGGRRKGLGFGFFGRKPPKTAKRAGRSRMADELDLDLESQTSIDLSGKMFEMAPMGTTGSSGGGGFAATGRRSKRRRNKAAEKDKVPGCLRLLTMVFKCCFWCVSIVVRALLAIAGCLFKCVFNEKL